MLARCVLAAMALTFTVQAASPTESWTPTSNTAEQFIGPVRFSPDRIDFRGGRYIQIAAAGTAPFVDETGARVNAAVYRVTGTGRNGGVLCDRAKIAFVLIWQSPPVGSDVAPRAINAFRGDRFVMGGPDDCGVFRFDAGRR